MIFDLICFKLYIYCVFEKRIVWILNFYFYGLINKIMKKVDYDVIFICFMLII